MRKPISSWSDSLLARLGFSRRRQRHAKKPVKTRVRHTEQLEPREMLAVDIAALPFHQILDNQDAAYAEIGSNWQGWTENPRQERTAEGILAGFWRGLSVYLRDGKLVEVSLCVRPLDPTTWVKLERIE